MGIASKCSANARLLRRVNCSPRNYSGAAALRANLLDLVAASRWLWLPGAAPQAWLGGPAGVVAPHRFDEFCRLPVLVHRDVMSAQRRCCEHHLAGRAP